ncbi:MRN complex-interacting protein [Bactrocera neohumeralis]|uniref:MRN complex-interacting protein n=1 Tax=Bactrocera neohumeralis TaxID=98809 RepID=UPI00216632DE|nr:MRN complex-interacting protein [Bactrocera neohumeralis]
MPQEIRVLQCTECKMFQVDLVKKVKTWTCKVCNVKQRSLTEYFRGSGPECRVLVQNLNKNKELTTLSTSTFISPNHMVLQNEQHISPSNYKKFKENGFASNESELNDKDFSGRNVDNRQNNNIESSLENTKGLAEIEMQNCSKRPSNDFYNNMKKTSKWDKYV